MRDTLLLKLFVGTDIVFMGLHVLHMYSGFFTDPQFSLTKERGFAETFQYLKEGWIATLLICLTRRTPNLLYPSWSLLFGYLLIDDLFEVHERLGTRIVSHFDLPPMFALRPQDFGELAVTASAAILFSALIGAGHYRGDTAARSFSRSLLGLLVLLVFFGVVFDMIHVMIEHAVWTLALDIVEEGGEMVVMSVIVWFVSRSFHGHRPALLC
jgi:hypothetical protein